MSTISRYVIVTDQDHEEDHEYEYFEDARKDAEQRGDKSGERLAIIARSYEYADSELVWTSNGSNLWPPARGK